MYYSTQNPQHRVSLEEAVLRGLPPDNGLYMPEQIRRFDLDMFEHLRGLSFQDLSFEVARQLLGEEIPADILRHMVREALSFDTPLVQLDNTAGVLELFHGPTMAFKDVGARFMAQLMAYFVQQHGGETLRILVATSGDTGGAVANGFFQVPGIEVVVLYPSGRVSFLQEKQLTTLGHNVQAIEVKGSFDDCQALVKQAFLDEELQNKLRLSSANSINIARLIPQTFYYFRGWQQAPHDGRPVVFSVPSGNFGNLTAGLMAKRLGLPVSHFIAATNINDVVPAYLSDGIYSPRPSVQTLSTAMDVGAPSNFARMMELYQHDRARLLHELSGFAFDDANTAAAIREVYQRYGYTMDPHSAVGWLALEAWQAEHPVESFGIVLSTAHPAKFPDIVEQAIGHPVEIPHRLAALADLPKQAIEMENDFAAFKHYLLQ